MVHVTLQKIISQTFSNILRVKQVSQDPVTRTWAWIVDAAELLTPSKQDLPRENGLDLLLNPDTLTHHR